MLRECFLPWVHTEDTPNSRAAEGQERRFFFAPKPTHQGNTEVTVLSEMYHHPEKKGQASSCVNNCSGVAGKLEKESDLVNAKYYFG